MAQLFSKLLILLGITFLAFFAYLLYLRYSPHPLTFEGKTEVVVPVSGEAPVRLIIPSNHVDVAIYPALIRNKHLS